MNIQIKIFADNQEIGSLDFSENTLIDLIYCVRAQEGTLVDAPHIRPISIQEILAYAQKGWDSTGASYRTQRINKTTEFLRSVASDINLTDEEVLAKRNEAKTALARYFSLEGFNWPPPVPETPIEQPV